MTPASSSSRRYAGLSADERDQERLSRLRETALDLFGTRGYTAVTVDTLCSTARVSTRHYYRIFRNKEDALLDLYSTITSAAVTGAVESLEQNADEHIEVRLRDALAAYLQPILSDPRIARVAFVEIVGVSARVEQMRLDFRAGIIDLVVEQSVAAVERGELEPANFRLRGLSMLGAINVVVHDWSVDPHGVPAKQLLTELTDLATVILTHA